MGSYRNLPNRIHSSDDKEIFIVDSEAFNRYQEMMLAELEEAEKLHDEVDNQIKELYQEEKK